MTRLVPSPAHAPFAAALIAIVVPITMSAQSLTTLESSRQLRDSAATNVRVRYAAGRLSMRPSPDAQLYRMELRYDPDRVEPIHTFDSTTRQLDLGVRADRVSFSRNMKDGSMRLELARGVPMDLSLEIGAAEAELDLGGLSLDGLHVQSGASSSAVRFDTPNPRLMRRLSIQSGAASFRAVRLANANTPIVSVDADVGGIDLDFGGRWTQDVDVDLQVAMGGATLRVPRDVGVRVEIDRALAGFDHDGLERDGRAWVTPNWNDAAHRMRVRGSAAFGKLTIERY